MKKSTFSDNLIILEKTISTNNYAIALLAEKRPVEGTLIMAHEQTMGKGCGTNTWHSQPGKNLTFSIILYPHFLNPEDEFYISKTISLALTDFLINFVSAVKIKWPNDIYVKDSKIGGILTENLISNGHFTASVIGVGLNMNQETFPSELPNPVSLFQLTGKPFDLNIMMKQLYYCLADRYEQLCRFEYNEITREYLARIYKYNRDCIFIVNDKEVTGRIVNIENNGKIVVADESGHSKKFNFKEIEYKV